MTIPDTKIVVSLRVPAKGLDGPCKRPVISVVLPQQPPAGVLGRAQGSWKGFLFGIGDLDPNTDFCHFLYQFRAGSREVAVNPQDVRSATQGLGVTPCFQKNIPEGPGLIDWSEGHPPDGQPGNGQSIEYEGAEPVPLCVLDLDLVPH
jgi:hypothetical protein